MFDNTASEGPIGLEKLGFQRDHVSTDDRGELVWLTRALG
jgi:hypothetical protein